MIKNYTDPKKKWNVIINYDTKFIEQYYKAISYISKIIEAMNDDDMITIIKYRNEGLKRIINKKVNQFVKFKNHYLV